MTSAREETTSGTDADQEGTKTRLAPEPPKEKQPARRSTARPRVVIVGAGFGGLNTARTLAGSDVDVLVLDVNNYHGFWPLLYQVATAALEPEAIAYPVRAIFRKHRNIRFQMAEARGVDFDRRLVNTSLHPVRYDYLVLAAGSTNNYFGNNALAEQTLGLKDIDEAERLRNRLLLSFERAASEQDPARRQALLTFMVIGGGPTGVELSGAFAELIRHVLRKDYPHLDMSGARVILVEAIDRLLPSFPESLQKSAMRKLEQMGVEIRLGSPVESVEGGVVTFKDGKRLEANTVVWAAGVRASALTDALGVELGRNSRVKVLPTLNLAAHPEVFVIGDMAYLEGYKEDQAYPMVAQVAIQQGKLAARNILRHARRQSLSPFRYFDQGTMATIGRRAAVLDAFGIRLSGRLAWLGWLFVHISYLIGFRNRLIVLTNWAFNYFTYDRGVRLITGRG
jgi:NADH:ubiquinone reductase (H+-translocating)